MTHTDMQYAAQLFRTALGALYAVHALLISAVFGAEHGALYFAGAEALAGILLASGVHMRAMAALLLPLPAAAVLFDFASAGYLAICIGGQLMLACGSAALATSLNDLYD